MSENDPNAKSVVATPDPKSTITVPVTCVGDVYAVIFTKPSFI